MIAEGPITLVELDTRAFDRLVGDPSDAGFAMRQLVLASLTRQLAAASLRLSRSAEQGARATASQPPPGKPEDTPPVRGGLDLMGVSDILEGWDLDAVELDEVRLVYDEDQRRSRKSGPVR